VLLPMLRGRGVGLSARERRLIALFGPRGLSTLLFVLLPVFAGVSGAEYLFQVACLVVLLSVVIHGGGIALFLGLNSARPARHADPAALPVVPPAAPNDGPEVEDRIGVDEVRALIARGEQPVIVDSRADRSYRASDRQAAGAVRVSPDDPVRDATALRLSQRATLVVYCA